ncbi:hypothetical protein AB4120_15045 [Cupriavidus sp. 2KB_3]|uniref:hypothetical protein n=1 Tax=Cupriavidus sp. 2KB_3 TaxID=3232980 RepID=UPI003F8EC67C
MSDSYQAIYDAVRSRIHGGDVGEAMREAIGQQASGLSYAIEGVKHEMLAAAMMAQRPSVQYRPTISIDGNQWCALYGDNLQDGVAGFGDSPAEAMADFDTEWHKKIGASNG